MSDLIPQKLPVAIEEEMKSSFMDYAMSVIIARALPDARDGLKPVHRRILYTQRRAMGDYDKALVEFEASLAISNLGVAYASATEAYRKIPVSQKKLDEIVAWAQATPLRSI